MSADQDEPRPTGRRRRARHARGRHPLFKVATWVLAVLVLALTAGTAFAVWKLNNNVHRVDVTKALGSERPTPSVKAQTVSGPMNILLMGSDTRTGLGTDQFGPAKEDDAHSDTTVLVHLSADRRSITAVSIPRDSMVPAPEGCSPNAPVANWVPRMWNSNFQKGGPGCAIRALEGNTGVFVDHYAVVNFVGFKDMVDALGGVQVCTNTAIDDADSGLTLSAGRHLLTGWDALAYVRVRHIGDGSDLSRIKRQQAFMASVAQTATSSSTLLRPDKLYGFLSAATKALTTDPGLGVSEMADIAQSLKGVGPENIQFLTIPVEDYAADRNRVQWSADAKIVWDAIRRDVPIGGKPSPSPSPSTTTDPAPTPTPTPLTVTPDKVSVRVLNGANVPMLATEVGRLLRAQGFSQIALGDAPVISGTVIEYSKAQAEAARTVAAAFPGATLLLTESMGDTVQVTVGTGSADVVAVPNRIGSDPLPSQTISALNASPAPTPTISARSAAQDICS